MLTTLACPTCAAALPVPAAATVVRCHFCGSSMHYAPEPPRDARPDAFTLGAQEAIWSTPVVLGLELGANPRIVYVDRYQLRATALGRRQTLVDRALHDDDDYTPARIGDRVYAQLENLDLAIFAWPSLKELGRVSLPSALACRPIVSGDALLCATHDHKVHRISLSELRVVDVQPTHKAALRKLGFSETERLPKRVTLGGKTFEADDDAFPDLDDLLPEALLASDGLLLLCALTTRERSTVVVAISPDTGAVRWRTDTELGSPFSFYLVDGVAMVHGDDDGASVGLDAATGTMVLRTEGTEDDARLTLFGPDGRKVMTTEV